MIEQLTIEGYRGFEKLSMEGLGRVNLLVGRNNNGKTSVLEAVRLLASASGLRAMMEVAKHRGEASFRDSTIEQPQAQYLVELGRFFHGHKPVFGDTLRIAAGEEGASFLATLKDTPGDSEEEVRRYAKIRDDDPVYLLRSADPKRPTMRQNISEARSDGVSLLNKELWDRLSYGGMVTLGDAVTPLLHIPTTGLTIRTLSELWASRVLDGKEGDVAAGLRSVLGSVRDLNFLGGVGTGGGSDRVFVGLSEREERVPLGSLGEGMTRMLGLSLALSSLRGGIFLVDEIDTGLHHSVLPDMWKLVMAAAEQNDVQVFATTHSEDCLEGLAEAVKDREERPADAGGPAVFRISQEHQEATRFDRDSFLYAMENGWEVRGR